MIPCKDGMEKIDFTSIYNRLRSSVIETHGCQKHNPALLFSAGCVIGGLFGPFILPFSLGGLAATIFHHEFETRNQNLTEHKEE